MLHLAAAAARFGRRAFAHRWNTTYAFDAHTREAGRAVAALPTPPDVILQNGALFAPGENPRQPYVLLLDHTRQLSMQLAVPGGTSLPAPVDYGPAWRQRETSLYLGARAIATFSRRVATSLQRDYGVPGHRIRVVGAGANLHPDRIERGDDGQTLLFVGKDFQRKGGLVLLRAFERLRQERPALKLIIAGPPKLSGLPQGVTFRGFVPPEQLPALFSQATLFVLPTLREPFGLAFLDAMACGLACVGTHVEAVPEVVEHGETGLLVPPGDDLRLADAIADLLDDPARTHAMGLRGRLRVDKDFLWRHVGERLERALLDAVGQPSGVQQRLG